MDPAQASVEPVESGAEKAAAPGYIPIDIGKAIPAEHKYEYLSIRAEGMPRGAVLSRGQDNGDETWSLTLEDLNGLAYIPAKAKFEPHLVCFRIVGVRGGFGQGIGSVDVNIDPGAVVPGTIEVTSAAAEGGGFADMAAQFQTQIDSEVARRLVSEKAAWEKSAQQRLAGAADSVESPAESAAGGVDPAQAAELQALVADAEKRVQTAEEAARAANDALYEAVARAEAAESSIGMNEEAEALRAQLMTVRRELSGVKASMRVRSGNKEEVEKAVRDAVEDEYANQMEEVHERYGQELERLTKLAAAGEGAAPGGDGAGDSSDFEARLAEARGAWEQEIAAKLASVESATKKAILQGREAAVAEARQQWDQEFQEKLAAAQSGAAPDQQQIVAAVQQAVAARDQEWQGELDRRIEKERAALQAEMQAVQPQAGGTDEDEVARRIEASQQEWQAAQNQFVEARDQEWQAEMDRRIEEERAAGAAVAASGLADGDPEAEQRLAAAQEEWAQSHTLELERRLLEAEEAWQAKDEERLQAAKADWEAGQQVLIAERDEQWKLELVRQLDEAKEAWQAGATNHTPELEMPVVTAAEDAPVGVTADGAPVIDAAAEATASEAAPVEATPAVFDESMEQEVVLDEELPSFFEEHATEMAPDREWLADPDQQEVGAAGLHAEVDDDAIPNWMEVWGEKLRVPPHWLPIIHRVGRRVSRIGGSMFSKLRQFIASRKPSNPSAPQISPAQPAPGQPIPGQPIPGQPVMPQLGAAKKGFRLPKISFAKIRYSKPGRLVSKLLRVLLQLVRVILRAGVAVLEKVLRVAVTVGIFVGLYHGYYFAKPYVYPHVKPYITSYWDPYAGPYVRVYWDPYVQPHIDKYWGSGAKPYIMNTWNYDVQPSIENSWDWTKSAAIDTWDWTKSLALDGWDAVEGLTTDSSKPARVGASVSRSAGKPKLSAVAPRVYLRPAAANLRSGPSKYAAYVGTTRQGDHIQRLEQNGGWTKIRIISGKMKVGWVHDSLLSNAPATAERREETE